MKIGAGQVWYNSKEDYIFLTTGSAEYFPSVGHFLFPVILDDECYVGHIGNIDKFYEACVCLGEL